MRYALFLPRLLAATLGIAGFGALMAPAPAAAQTACPPTINQCGCTITAAGSYKIGLPLTSTQGLTSDGACIEISANYVILDGAKGTVTGPGGTSPTGIGIWVRRSARTDFLGFRGTVISGWDVGLLIEGSDIYADDLTANKNGTAGVELYRAKAVELTNTTAESNLNYGIWLKQAAGTNISNSLTETNGNIGLYVGCSDLGPIGAKCPGIGTSPGNFIFTGNITGNAKYGVALDIGANSTLVTNQTPGGGTNSKDDLYDANSSCGSNKWFGDASTATNNQPGGCIK